jgi:hypothetical protein
VTSLLAYFRSLGGKFFRRAETEREMEEELRSHVEHRIDDLVRSGLDRTVAGAATGLVSAAVVSHLMTGLLYGVGPTDPLTFAGVALLLIAVALLACYVPARRAMKVDPMIALREA